MIFVTPVLRLSLHCCLKVLFIKIQAKELFRDLRFFWFGRFFCIIFVSAIPLLKYVPIVQTNVLNTTCIVLFLLLLGARWRVFNSFSSVNPITSPE